MMTSGMAMGSPGAAPRASDSVRIRELLRPRPLAGIERAFVRRLRIDAAELDSIMACCGPPIADLRVLVGTAIEPSRDMPFLGAHPSLLHALVERGITEPTAVQRAILEIGDPNADVLVSAQTGSGKTVGFGLAIAPTILGDAEAFAPSEIPKGQPCGPLALVITPTRELAQQVARELEWLYAPTKASIATCVGGTDPKRELHALARRPVIVVGTPGRLCDHLDRGALTFERLRAVVLDEADEMLDMGFREDLERILQAVPAGAERRTLLFSATLPPDIVALARRYQRDAVRIATAGDSGPHADIDLRAILIRPADRTGAVVNLLRYHEAPSALVFCATRDGVTDLAAELRERGFSVVALSGELSQRERTASLGDLRGGRARVLVATDVAARGLDLPELELVVHADLPQNREGLVHRSGRTGRAGKKGTAVVLVPVPRRGFAERVLFGRQTAVTWTTAPTAAEIEARDLARIDTEIDAEVATLGDRDRALGAALAAKLSPADLAALVVRGRLALSPAPADVRVVDDRSPGPARARDRRDDRDDRPRDRDDRPRDRDDRPRDRADRPRDGNRPPPGPRRPPGSAPERAASGYVVFRVNVGRRGNADPRWLVPVLCRRGDVDRAVIGKIRILGGETHVEIAADRAEAFAVAVARPDPRDKKVKITPLTSADV
jgi:ATP-dependent RNA helicase DeaD